MTCHFCNQDKETRPYGPNGEPICTGCAFKDEDSTRATHRAMDAAFAAAGSVAVVNGDETGVRRHPLSDAPIH